MKLKYGMIGGGIGSLIGAAHRDAAAATGQFELVSGCFSSNADRSASTGSLLGLDPSRVYGDWETMLENEHDLDMVVIATPNHLHYGPAHLALSRGIHVVVDKPMTWSLEEARELRRLVSETKMVLAVTYTHAGYPAIESMRRWIASGMIGDVKKVYAEYLQGWMSEHADPDFKRHASWRMDPAKSGISCAAADIGVHAFYAAEHVSGLKVERLSAMMNSVVEGHALDDDATAMLMFENGATGTLVVSQIATGEGNHMRLRIYGDKASMEWNRSSPDVVVVKYPDLSIRYLHGGQFHEVDPATLHQGTALKLDAFSVIYNRVADAIKRHASGDYETTALPDYPTVEDGFRGMQFIEAMVASSAAGSAWCKIEKTTDNTDVTDNSK